MGLRRPHELGAHHRVLDRRVQRRGAVGAAVPQPDRAPAAGRRPAAAGQGEGGVGSRKCAAVQVATGLAGNFEFV